MKLYVDENVLIPRPETEELVDLVVKDVSKESRKEISILDIGTGSGCIPIALKKRLPPSKVYGVDVSEAALDIAKNNAAINNADVNFILSDILDESRWNELPAPDIIVSNPPYIPLREKDKMQSNVTRYEPHIALFVPDNDPMLFYKTIGRFAEKKLLPGGKIFVEIHEDYGNAVADVFAVFNPEVVLDMQGKARFVVSR